MGLQQYTYFVALILPEPLLGQVEALKQIIAEKFGSQACLKAPAHITLIPPFWFTDDQRVISALRSFAWNKPIELHLNGYGTFGKKVLFIKPEHNETLHQLQQAIKTHFQCVLGLKDNKNKKLPFVPHVTIGNRDWNEMQFMAARDYFTQQVPFEATCRFTSISLLKFEGGKWRVVDSIPLSNER